MRSRVAIIVPILLLSLALPAAVGAKSPNANPQSERARTMVSWGVFTVALVLQRHRDIEAIAAFAGALQEQFPVAPRPFLRDAWRFLDQALEVVHLPAQILFESGEFLLLLIERRVGANASACHGAPNDSGRSGKRK